MDLNDVTRRTMLRSTALGAVAVPVLAACGGGQNGGDDDGGGDGGGGFQSGDVITTTTDVEVGGAAFVDGVVVTQPSEGEFHAFSRTCTHQRCDVTGLQDGKIHCPCHDSLYDLATGANVGGPAPSPLTKVDITVDGTNIKKA
ncbi:MAG TPA: Rieske (2Fe-2S) protein [Nocardioidaceae bacterium]|nr:Rieske (2Fe-2S) protein [Nocardioidaceae bacterium]